MTCSSLADELVIQVRMGAGCATAGKLDASMAQMAAYFEFLRKRRSHDDELPWHQLPDSGNELIAFIRTLWMESWRHARGRSRVRAGGRIRRDCTRRIGLLANREEQLVRRVEQILRRHGDGLACGTVGNDDAPIALSVKDVLVIDLQIVERRRGREREIDWAFAGSVCEQTWEGRRADDG